MNRKIDPKRYQVYQKIIKIVGAASIFISIFLIAYLIRGLNIFKEPDALAELIKNHMLIGSIVFFIVQIVQVVIPIIPGGITTVVGFMAFGPVWGFVLNYISLCIGSLILFWLVKEYGRAFILLFVDEKHLQKYERHLSSKNFERFFIFNMISPVAPADIMVMVTGLSHMSYYKFIRIILLCKPFSTIAYGYLWIYGGQWIQQFL